MGALLTNTLAKTALPEWNPQWTVNELLGWARAQFLGMENRDIESRMLLSYVADKDAARLITDAELQLSATQTARYKDIVIKRKKGIPLAYLTGTREFWSLPISVTNQVLIPRHETETLVERVLVAMAGCANARILELGTGSGAIALALASELPDTNISATDNAVSALTVARSNQRALALDNIEFLQSDWFGNLGNEKYHLICANPPYLSADDKHLQLGDVRFEPRAALVAAADDRDGYAAIRHIITAAKTYLYSAELATWSGWIVLEHGFEQGCGVRKLLSDYAYNDITTHQDLSGNDRVTMARSN